MKRERQQFQNPRRPWDRDRIATEKKTLAEYGLRRKKEVWKAEAVLRNFRRRARVLAVSRDETMVNELVSKIVKLGLANSGATLDDVLGLTLDKLLERRLQTLVFRKGFANTPKQARQFVVHGHIAVGGRRTMWPSALVSIDDEASIEFYGKSEQLKEWVVEQKNPQVPDVKEESPAEAKEEVKSDDTKEVVKESKEVVEEKSESKETPAEEPTEKTEEKAKEEPVEKTEEPKEEKKGETSG